MAASRTPDGFYSVRIGMGLFSGPLSSDLYTPGRCVCELVRNGMVACQDERDGAAWDPKRIHVELEIVPRHPLVGGDALVGMDRGHGFTKGDLERFLTVGPDEMDVSAVGRHGGAAQKQIGRFSYLALRRDRGPDTGFTILTRTSTDGPVTWIEVTPQALKEQKLPHGTYRADATELGRYRSYHGRFSAVVIPHPQIRTNDELVSELAPHLPRKAELCGMILIGGKQFVPPPLASGAIVKPDGVELEAYLGRAERGMREGIHLVDLTTGFRVGFGPALLAHLPYPFGRPDLTGDIFLPGLLSQQETTRSGLRAGFLRGKQWKRIVDLLTAHVADAALGLLDDAGAVDTSAIGRLLSSELCDLFRQTYGEPDLSNPPPDGITPPPPPPGPPRGPHGPRGPRDPNPTPRKRRYVGLKIGNETWWIGVTRDDPDLFAIARDETWKFIMTNAAYDLTPKVRAAAAEHAMLGVLGAVARLKFPFETTEAQRFVSEHRRALRDAAERKKTSD